MTQTSVLIPTHECIHKKHVKVSVTTLEASTCTHRALVVNHERKYEVQENFETPSNLADHEVKIRSRMVGLNHIDFKSIDFNFCLPAFPWITGREMAGVIEEVGPGVEGLQKGQPVWTSTYYRDRRAGCFQEYVIVPKHTVTVMGPNMSFKVAACLGVCGLTAAMTLWKWFEVPMPLNTTKASSNQGCSFVSEDCLPYLLIWGGSSVTGQFLIQLAKLSNLRVISVGSTETARLVKALGADEVVQRDGKTDAEIVTEIRTRFGEHITMAVDLVDARTAACTRNCLSTNCPAKFAPLALHPEGQTPTNVVTLQVEMKQFVLDPTSSIYSNTLTRLVEAGSIQMPEIEILPGGLNAIEGGLERLKNGSMAGKKLVVDMGPLDSEVE